MANSELLAAVSADFAKDTAKETGGAWMTYGKRRYLIARAHRNNVEFQKMMEVEMRPYQWATDRGNLDAVRDVALVIMHKVYAKTILLAIENIDGSKMAYAPEDGVVLFEALPDFWDAVYKFADNGRNYIVDLGYTPAAIKADSGN